MIKVRFLKDHVRWKTGDIAVLDNTQAAYLEKMKVAEMQGIERPEDTEKVLFQHLEPEKKKKTAKKKA